MKAKEILFELSHELRDNGFDVDIGFMEGHIELDYITIAIGHNEISNVFENGFPTDFVNSFKEFATDILDFFIINDIGFKPNSFGTTIMKKQFGDFFNIEKDHNCFFGFSQVVGLDGIILYDRIVILVNCSKLEKIFE